MNNYLDWVVCGRMIVNFGLIVIKFLVLSLILSGLEIGFFWMECVGFCFKVLGDYVFWLVVYWIVFFYLIKLLLWLFWVYMILIGVIFLWLCSGLILVCVSWWKVLLYWEFFCWVESVFCLIRIVWFWFVFGVCKLCYFLKRINWLFFFSWIFFIFCICLNCFVVLGWIVKLEFMKMLMWFRIFWLYVYVLFDLVFLK